jgi:Protein of unknown function (DUF1186)
MSSLKLINYEVTYEPLYGDYKPSPAEQQIMQKSYNYFSDGKKATPQYIKSLEDAVEKYPLNQTFKNYLATAYKVTQNDEAHLKIALQTVEQHPDYFFGKAVLAEIYLEEERFEEAAALMENFSDIGVIYPDRRVFHVSEVKMFNILAAEYFALIDDREQMDIRLKMLKKVADKGEFRAIESRVQMMNLTAGLKRMQERQKSVKTIDGNFRGKEEQTAEAPVFKNHLIEELYHQDFTLGEGIITAILALPRESLIEDLEKVLEDAINRYDFFVESGWDEKGSNFPIHAIMLLGELKSYESLPHILNFLKQGSEFVDFWFGDIIGSFLLRTIYELGKEELGQIEAFMKEPDVFWICKNTVSNILKNIAELDASKRAEVRNVFENLLDFFWEKQHDEAICDHSVISSIIYDMAHLQITGLEDSMKRFYDAKLIDINMNGDWGQIEEMYEYPSTSKVSAVPTLLETYKQFANRNFEYDYVKYDSHPVMAKKYREMTDKAMDSDAFRALTGRYDDDDDYYDDEDDYFYQPTKPLVSTKIDRNARVNVRYKDGKEVKDVKYKKVEDDVTAGKCVIF